MHRGLLALAALLGALAILPSGTASAVFDSSRWQYQRQLTMSEGLASVTPVQAVLDRDVYMHSAAGLTDLRIVDGDGTEIPFLVERMTGQSRRVSVSLTVQDSGHVAGRYTQFTIDTGELAASHNRISIRSGDSEFWREVEVESSHDGSEWAAVATGEIYRIRRNGSVTAEYLTLTYPQSTARYLRVRVLDDGSGPIDIRGASMFLDESTPASTVSWPVTSFSQTDDTVRKATEFEFDLGTSGLPYTTIELETLDSNFHRQVIVQASADRERWRSIGQRSAIYSYTLPGAPAANLILDVAESRERYVRVVIFNQDSPPIDVTGVEVSGVNRRVVFLAASGSTYRLQYGNPDASAPAYDIGAVLRFSDTETYPEMSLGPEMANPLFTPVVIVEPVKPLTERMPWLVPTAVGFAAAIVGFLLLSILRQARNLMPPDPQH